MRQTLILFISFVLLLSCNNADTIKVSSNVATPNQQSDTTKTKTERQILIEELIRLQAVLRSNDKEKIADLFSFPVSNDILAIYIDDSTFNTQLEKNGSKVTRAMFISHFQEISEGLQIDQINQLFRKIDVGRLLQKDTLEHEAIVKTNPCYHIYGVGVERDLVTLTVATNSNQDYKSKSVSKDELPENDSSICEHVLWWVFRFDGNKLHFKNISGAG